MNKFKRYNILLGSGSPRRRDLLASLDIDFRQIAIKDVDESYPSDMPAEEVPAYLSRVKAEAYRDELNPGDILITADTVVILDGKILGKPEDERQAVEMLTELSGRTHEVVTGVTLMALGAVETFSEKTAVSFAEISSEDIEHYVTEYRPLDKAGAYGVQEWIGQAAVTGINGCFYNVMGLPTSALYHRLGEFVRAISK